MSSRRTSVEIEQDPLDWLCTTFQIWKYGFVYPQFYYIRSSYMFRFTQSSVRVMLCAVVLSSFFIAVIFCKEFGRSSLMPVLNQIYLFYLFFYTFFTIDVTYRNIDTIEEILKSIVEIHLILKRRNYHCKFKGINIGLIWATFLAVNNIVVTILCLYLPTSSFDLNWANIFISFLHYPIDIQFQLFYVTFKFILINYFRTFNNFLSKVEKHENIRNFIEIRTELDRINILFSTIFSYKLLLGCFQQWYSIVVSLFVNVMEPYEVNEFSAWVIEKMVVSNWIIINILSIFMIVGTDAIIFSKSKSVAENIERIQNNVGRRRLPYKNTELFLLNSRLNDQTFLIGGFFPLDWTLIYSMVAGISTYLVYLIQFREMELHKQQVHN